MATLPADLFADLVALQKRIAAACPTFRASLDGTHGLHIDTCCDGADVDLGAPDWSLALPGNEQHRAFRAFYYTVDGVRVSVYRDEPESAQERPEAAPSPEAPCTRSGNAEPAAGVVPVPAAHGGLVAVKES